jgi:hypothetical protein
VVVCFVDIGGIVASHCLGVIVCFVDISGVVDHHCLEVVVRSLTDFVCLYNYEF